jgi:cation:H+ antiporter
VLLAVFGVVAGLAVLTVAADQFVVGATRLSAIVKLPTVVIGAVVIGFGTSAPELIVTWLAAGQDAIDVAAGNIVGSNLANLTLVLGIAALVTPLVVRSPVLKREAPLSLLAVIAFGVVVQNGVSAVEGMILLTVLVVSLAIIVISSRGGDPQMTAEVEEFLADGSMSTGREVARTLVGLGFTLGAAQVLIVSATTIAAELGLNEGFVGLTVVAIGTSLPELATALQAARRDETDLIIGNLLGSNLFNSAAVGAVLVFGGSGQTLDPSITGLGVYLMVGVAVIATLFMITGRKVVRFEGVLLLAGYLAVLPLLA